MQARLPQPLASRQPITESRVVLANPSIEANSLQQTAAFVTDGPLLPVNAVSGTDRNPISSIAFGISSHPAQRHWDKQRAHLEEKDGEVRLWLRDTRMSASQGLELAMTLRKRFAELGVKLARFTLNGQPYDQLNSFPQTPLSNY